MLRTVCCLLIVVSIFVVGAVSADDTAVLPQPDVAADHARRIEAGLTLFKSTVRQVLVERCLDCHGGESLEGEFNLATRDGLLKGGEHGVAIVPGKSVESRLFRLIAHTEKPSMPYDEEKLPGDVVAAIGKWIDLEAPYDKPLIEGDVELTDWTQRTLADGDRDFWSFRPLSVVVPPEVTATDWCRTDVDRFVLRALEDRQIAPNDIGDRRTLIRRAYFDLIGLPPDPEELERHMRDSSPQWYEDMIAGLLDSPHFGERWARHWLDISRFAESHGFEQDYNRDFAYHFRDFVIKAFNSDMPFDRFIQWQLAGDEIAPENPLALMATGFMGAGVFPTQLTEKEFEPARYDELDDMVSTMGTAMLGMTIGCARCHDHKFDPIPAADYYRLISTFGLTIRSNVEVDLEPETTRRQLDQWEAERQPLVAALEHFDQQELGRHFDTWLAKRDGKNLEPSTTPGWLVLHIADANSTGGTTLSIQPDESVLANGMNPDFDSYTLTAETQIRALRSLRLEALSHESMVNGGPGRASNGNMGLGTISIRAEPLSGDGQAMDVILTRPRATFEQNSSNLSIAASIDGKKKTGWAVDPQFGRDHAASFDFAEPVGFAGGTRLIVTLEFDVNNRHNIGRARLAVSTAIDRPALHAPVQPQAIAELNQLAASGAELTDESERAKFLSLYRTIDPEWKELAARIVAHDQAKPTPKLTTVMVSSEGVKPIPHHADGRGFPHFYEETFFLKRGDATQKVRAAAPGFLQALTIAGPSGTARNMDPPAGWHTSYRRRALADWITNTKSGAGQLLARVIVNRLWQHHLGRGIVATPNDFGRQGDLPTHPELLDWLAQRLIDGGWRLKPIHKLIMTSAVYQQSANFDATRSTVDPENQFYWRREPQRLEAEVIRDAMLAVSDQLDRTPFGPGTLDEGHKRRSIYFMIKRSSLIPMMQIFDFPEPLASVGDRPSTTVASQALMFMNNAQVREYSAGFAQRVRVASGTDVVDSDVVDQVYLTGLSRRSTVAEQSAARTFLAAQSASYQADGQSPNAADLLALTDLCQTMFSLNEFVFIP